MYLNSCPLTALELLAVKHFMWRDARGNTRTVELEAARPAHTRMLVCFSGIGVREAASELTNGELLVEASQLPDPGPGQVYQFQLFGLEVRTEDGRSLGILNDILATGAHPVYIVDGERELLIPAIPEVVLRVDLEARVITVRLPLGLEEAMG